MTEPQPHTSRRRGTHDLSKRIGEALGETKPGPLILIRRLVKQLGPEVSQDYLRRTLDIEQAGGMMNAQGTQRRTPGGVFFHLIKTERGAETHTIFWKRVSTPRGDRDQAAPSSPSFQQQPRQSMSWNERVAIVASITRRGTVSAKITLTGHIQPDSVVDQQSCIVLSMESAKAPSVPKGVPIPPPEPTRYTVYISRKLWTRIAQAAQDPEDSLIIDGFPRLDSETASIAVIATGVSTKKLKAAEKQKQPNQEEGEHDTIVPDHRH